MKNIDWVSTCTILSAFATAIAAICSAVSAFASMRTVKVLTEPKIERNGEQLRVPSNLIRKDASGPFIPQYGRLIMADGGYEKLKKSGSKVMLVCMECTDSDSSETKWAVCSVDPM